MERSIEPEPIVRALIPSDRDLVFEGGAESYSLRAGERVVGRLRGDPSDARVCHADGADASWVLRLSRGPQIRAEDKTTGRLVAVYRGRVVLGGRLYLPPERFSLRAPTIRDSWTLRRRNWRRRMPVSLRIKPDADGLLVARLEPAAAAISPLELVVLLICQAIQTESGTGINTFFATPGG